MVSTDFGELGSLQDIEPPEGLMGDIYSYVYHSSPRPVPEVALTAAIALMAGVTGRAYNVSNCGLNQYILLLAPTGTGKESLNTGVTTLLHMCEDSIMDSLSFLGPSDIASGPALVKHVQEHPSCVSIVGEFGHRLEQLCRGDAVPTEITFRRMLLDFYSKSGRNAVVNPLVYSKRSDNTAPIRSPSFSLVGESTPGRVYDNLTTNMVAEGLIPRFMIVEYEGKRPPFNKKHAKVEPDLQLMKGLETMILRCQQINRQQNMVIDVVIKPDAEQYLDAYDAFCDQKINANKRDTLRQLWNRCHLKALKLAALVAVGRSVSEVVDKGYGVTDPTPAITVSDAQWAVNLVQWSTSHILDKFTSGTLKESKAMERLLFVGELFRNYPSMTLDEALNDANTTPQFVQDKILPKNWLFIRCKHKSVFFTPGEKSARWSTVKRTMDALVKEGIIKQLTRQEITKAGYTLTSHITPIYYRLLDLNKLHETDFADD